MTAPITAAGGFTQTELLEKPKRESFFTELKEGFHYTTKNHFALTILLMNIIWATGGGAINVIFERMGGIVFAARENINPDLAVAIMWTAGGFGLFIGMFVAHRTEAILERRKAHSSFIGWSLILHGVLFAVGAYMPYLWLFLIFRFYFAGDCRCRIRRSGNAFSAKFAGLYSRSNFDSRSRRGNACFRFVELFFERTDVLHLAGNADRYFRNFIGRRRRGLVFKKPPQEKYEFRSDGNFRRNIESFARKICENTQNI